MTATPRTADEALDAATKEMGEALDLLGDSLDRLDGIDTEVLNGWQATRRRKLRDHAQRALDELYGWNRQA